MFSEIIELISKLDDKVLPRIISFSKKERSRKPIVIYINEKGQTKKVYVNSPEGSTLEEYLKSVLK